MSSRPPTVFRPTPLRLARVEAEAAAASMRAALAEAAVAMLTTRVATLEQALAAHVADNGRHTGKPA